MRTIIYLIIAVLYFPFCSAEERPYLLFSGTTNVALAEKIAQCLDMKLSPVNISRFNDGEIKIKVEEKCAQFRCLYYSTDLFYRK